MTKKIISIAAFMCLILAACGNGDNEDEASADSDNADAGLTEVEVAFITEQDGLSSGQEEEIQVSVTQGDENVEDANEVLFEIWEKGDKENSVSLEAEHDGEGIYSLPYTFEKDGIYEITAHVTARDMHTMPTEEFNIGNVNEADYEGVEDDEEQTHEHGEHEDHEEHGDHEEHENHDHDEDHE